MSKIIGGLSGSSKIKKGAKRAIGELSNSSFTSGGAFGNVALDESGLNISGGPGTSLLPGLEQAAAGQLAAGTGTQVGELGLTPDQLFAATGGEAFGTGALQEQGQGFLGAAGNFLQGLQDFDFSDFVGTQLGRLNELAGPGEERAAASLANRLFAGGRLGGNDTQSGVAFGELQQAQERAATERSLQAIGLARDELTSRITNAGALSGLGQQAFGSAQGLQSASIQDFLNRVGGATGLSGFQAGLQSQRFGNALNLTGGLSAALQPSQTGATLALAGADLGFQRQAQRAGIQSGRGIAEGNARGSLTSGILGGIL